MKHFSLVPCAAALPPLALSLALALALTVALALPLPARAADAPDDVLVENNITKLTRADYENELLRLPPGKRTEFESSPKRITDLLNNLLTNKTLAAQAFIDKLDRDPVVIGRLQPQLDQFYAEAEIAAIEDKAGAEFDAKTEQVMPKARELYLLNQQKYMTKEQITVSHILIEPRKHGDSDAAALALAREARAKLVAGADFATLAKAMSDDPSAQRNGGHLEWFAAGRMDPEFSKAAFALPKVGDISEPVKTGYGYHIIVLEGRRGAHQLTFDEAKASILAEMRARYVNEQRDARISQIRNDPSMKINQAAVDALFKPIDPAVYQQSLGKAGESGAGLAGARPNPQRPTRMERAQPPQQ